MAVTSVPPASNEGPDPPQATRVSSAAKKIEEIETEIANLYETMPFGCFTIGDHGLCTDINRLALSWLGRAREEVIGKPALHDWITPESWEKLQRHDAESNDKDYDAFELELISKSGVIRPVALTIKTMVGLPGECSRRRSILLDLTEQKRAREHRKIESLAFESPAGICIIDMAGNILHFNKAFCRLTRYAPEDVKGNVVQFIKSKGLNQPSYRLICRDLKALGSWEGEIREQHKDGSPFIGWLSLAGVGEREDAPSYYIATLYDITENRTTQDKISRLAAFDSLTKLPNRRTLQERVTRELSIAARSGLHGALLFIDLNNFKSINDTKGHGSGDVLLFETGQRLRDSVRKEDMVARIGGDEFIVLLTNLSADPKRAAHQARMIGEKILVSLGKPYQFPDFEFVCPASIGIAIFVGGETVEDLLQQADLAMYKAKKTGGSGLLFFDQAMQAAALAHTFLEQEIRHAATHHQLELYFQPQVNELRQIIAAEGLLRWRHPSLGLVAPSDFIPVAEETGLILPIGLWVLQAACAQLQIWEKNPRTRYLHLSVNISARQFSQPNFVDTVLKAIKESAIDPTRLILELTESMMYDIADSKAKMQVLQEFGITFSLDDFGTGYSSLSLLTKLPLAQLKIDKSFVRDMLVQPLDTTVVETIIGMAINLGLNVIAEGVETEAERNFLLTKGCTLFQGYLFSPPLQLDAFEEFLFANQEESEQSSAPTSAQS
jgi:diguanylate cyclase (GGDEF)-like protein/PAS domain S-box-containing protein